MWYKDAIVYNLDVEVFADSNGDGIGDFRGLTDRIDHLENLGVTCIWLAPFFPSPNRDDGYDITDYYTVDPRLGTLGDFAECSQALEERGIRLVLDLVVNHTSDEHPWFKAACADPKSPFRDWYCWSKTKPKDADKGMVFPGVQKTTWTWNESAGAYYYHRFFAHQPDLNIEHPAVREEILKIMGFWTKLGVSGFRIDAAPFLIEMDPEGDDKSKALYEFLSEMYRFLSWRCGDAILLAEANITPDLVPTYVGSGDRMQMLFNFLINQPMWLAFARQDAEPLSWALRGLPPLPARGQWAQFLRSHDELDLGRLSKTEREEVFQAFGPSKDMQLYDRGIRRRVATMFGGDQRRIAMAHSLIFSLPGTQVIRYGDEIGMGDDLRLEERLAIRTPMQWSDGPNAGFSKAPKNKLIRPVIDKGALAYKTVNVATQLSDRDSLLNRMEHLIRIRRSSPEVGQGEICILTTDRRAVFAHASSWQDRTVIALHNLGAEDCTVKLDLSELGPLDQMRNLVGDKAYTDTGDRLELSGFGYRWLRLHRADTN